MKGKLRGVIIVFLSLSVISSSVILINYDQKYRAGYLLDEQVPGIVKGTAKMVDTEAFFTKHELQQSSVKLDLVCNNSDNLEISLGYKSPTEPLAIANYPIKERTIWSKTLNSYRQLDIEDKSRLTFESDLSTFGFTSDEYIKADERIYFLRINEVSGGPYGYKKNVTTEINGSYYEIPEFIPNIHYIEKFQLIFDDLIFETMLYPFFDGSTEIIIPIRGASHELKFTDAATEYEVIGKSKESYTTTTPGTGSSSLWAVVFGTSDYSYPFSTDLHYPPVECRCFMLGCVSSLSPDEFEVGIMDYGWRVAYCMDGDSDQTDIATCEKTDDDFLEDMLDFADNQLGLTGKLIVYVACHGNKYAGNHHTMTGKTKNFGFWTNSVKLSEYEDKVEAITDDGTHVLLWILACHGDGLDSFSSSDHNDCLESWSYRDIHTTAYFPGDMGYTTFRWSCGTPAGQLNCWCEQAFFFKRAYEGACEYTASEIGLEAKTYYDDEYDSTMYIQSTWGSSYNFYINWGY